MTIAPDLHFRGDSLDGLEAFSTFNALDLVAVSGRRAFGGTSTGMQATTTSTIERAGPFAISAKIRPPPSSGDFGILSTATGVMTTMRIQANKWRITCFNNDFFNGEVGAYDADRWRTLALVCDEFGIARVYYGGVLQHTFPNVLSGTWSGNLVVGAVNTLPLGNGGHVRDVRIYESRAPSIAELEAELPIGAWPVTSLHLVGDAVDALEVISGNHVPFDVSYDGLDIDSIVRLLQGSLDNVGALAPASTPVAQSFGNVSLDSNAFVLVGNDAHLECYDLALDLSSSLALQFALKVDQELLDSNAFLVQRQTSFGMQFESGGILRLYTNFAIARFPSPPTGDDRLVFAQIHFDPSELELWYDGLKQTALETISLSPTIEPLMVTATGLPPEYRTLALLPMSRPNPRFVSRDALDSTYAALGWDTNVGWDAIANNWNGSNEWLPFCAFGGVSPAGRGAWITAPLFSAGIATSPCWLQLKYPRAVVLESFHLASSMITVQWRLRVAREWTMQGSNDGTTWTVVQ
jgi:hypothetical protein